MGASGSLTAEALLHSATRGHCTVLTFCWEMTHAYSMALLVYACSQTQTTTSRWCSGAGGTDTCTQLRFTLWQHTLLFAVTPSWGQATTLKQWMTSAEVPRNTTTKATVNVSTTLSLQCSNMSLLHRSQYVKPGFYYLVYNFSFQNQYNMELGILNFLQHWASCPICLGWKAKAWDIRHLVMDLEGGLLHELNKPRFPDFWNGSVRVQFSWTALFRARWL